MKTQFNIRLDNSLKIRTVDFCKRKGTNVSALIHALLFDYLNENDNLKQTK